MVDVVRHDLDGTLKAHIGAFAMTKPRSYTLREKLEVIDALKFMSVNQASCEYEVLCAQFGRS